MDKRIIRLIVAFLMFVPFRLPIAVMFIEAITRIASIAGPLTHGILAANIVVTKLTYNIVLGSIAIYNTEHLSRKIKGRKAIYDRGTSFSEEGNLYWWSILIAGILICYIIFDTISTYDIFVMLNPKQATK